MARRMKWPQLLARTAIWLGAEIALTSLGLDNLADYSEYLFRDRSDLLASGAALVMLVAG